jgi:hypothetical protein
MDEQQDNTSNATTDETGPDDSEPTPERQAELRQAYEANIAVCKSPYSGVVIRTRGELMWIIRERGWRLTGVGSQADIPDFTDAGIRADLSDVDLGHANLQRVLVAAPLSEMQI